MNTEEEQKILSEAPDFDNQIKILKEEKMVIKKRRILYMLILGVIVLVVVIFVFSYSHIYHYYEHGKTQNNNCANVNLKIDGSLVPNLNISEGNNCIPMYNIDYMGNRMPLFNVDLYGDRTELFNKINQLDENGTCILNCDVDKDGWPDVNIDTNGDGKVDLNVSKNNNLFCDLNCDINGDMIPDTNLDVDGDGRADVNITDNNDYKKPIKNIDYMGNRIPTFNLGDGTTNRVNEITNNKECDSNCDIDGDGWPDYNIILTEDSEVINKLSTVGENSVLYDGGKTKPWRCYFSRNLDECYSDVLTKTNTYENIDVDGDGRADINIPTNNGSYANPLNISTEINGEKVVLNEDRDLDGFPDYNIDVNGDGIPDLNITEVGSYECIKNCDINKDGKPDHLIEVNNNKISYSNLNIDINYDGECDINCDIDYDLNPELNIDTNGDGVPDINIDFDHDGHADYNIDTNNDYKPDENIDAYGIGNCNFNCNNSLINNFVNNGANCTKNCDTNSDGLPDKNVDINGDNVCDFNCDNQEDTTDQDNNYYLDNSYGEEITLLEVNENSEENFYITNPLSIQELEIKPGWEGKYVLIVTNNSNHAVKYRLYWTNVTNEYTNINNLDYFITRNKTSYLNGLKAPRKDIIIDNNLVIKANSTIKYVLDIRFTETNQNQNIDSGKTFYGHFKVDVIK